MILLDDYVEIENFLSLDKQDQLLQHLTHPSFPWAMSLDAVYGAEGKVIDPDAAIGFFHTAMFKAEPCSSEYPNLNWVIDDISKKTHNKLKIDTLFRVRVGLFTKHPSDIPHKAHVDADIPHWTCIYYVNECDGDTVVYNETWPQLSQEAAPTAKFTEKYRCKPKKGKLVAFNGKYYHSSSYPTSTPLRLAITFNFTVL